MAREVRAESAADRSAIRERRFRALAEPLDVRWRTAQPFPLLEVRNPVRKTRYLTMWPGYPDREPGFCTCTDFARRGLGDCKHLEAAWRWLASPTNRPRPEDFVGGVEGTFDPGLIWKDLDQALAAPPPLVERGIRELSKPGRELIRRATDRRP